MSQAVSSSYHTAIKSENSVQDFFLFDTEAPFNYLSAIEGDFVAGTPTIRRSVCESQDFKLGECPSASLSVTIANPYGDGIQFWSNRGGSGLTKNVWARAGIGVRLSSGSSASTSNKADVTITFNGGATKRIYVNSSGTLYVGSASASGYSNATSIHCVYADETTYTVYIGMSNGTVQRMTVTSSSSSMPSRTSVSVSDRLARKLKERSSVVYDGYGFPKTRTVYDTDSTSHSETWEYCPVGVYLLKYPKYNLHSAYIDVTDAMDALSRLDTSLKELADANNIDLNVSADVLVNSICSLRGIPMRGDYAFSNSKTVPVTDEMITADITCRQFFKWVGERAGHMWKMDPVGYLVTYFPPATRGQSSEYSVSEDLIAAGCEIYNEYIAPPDKLVIYYGDDLTYTSSASSSTREDYYKISGNPLYTDPEAESPVMPFLTYSALNFERYQIGDCMVVAADPSYGYGDIMYISLGNSYMTYIMQETLSFGIRVTAHYEATGNDARPDETSATYTGVVVGQFDARIAEAIAEASGSVRSVDVQYYSSTSATELSGGEWSTDAPEWVSGRYIWTRTVYYRSDGTSDTSDAVCITGNTGADGSGASVTIRSTSVTYQASSSGTVVPTGTWSATIPAVADGSYLWTKTVVEYDPSGSTTSYSVAYNGMDGLNGDDGDDGNGIASISYYYSVTTTASQPSASSITSTSFPSTFSATNKYVWRKEVITFTNESPQTIVTLFAVWGDTGTPGTNGTNGVSISSVTEHYQRSSSSTNAPTSWQSTPPTLTSTYRYLWNYETINYSNGTSSDTTKRVIGMYSEDGAAGRSVGSVVNYYLASSSSSGVTTGTSGWTTTVQSVTATKKYLWNYEVVYDTSNAQISATAPCIIGVYGDTGVSISSVTEHYQRSSSSTTAPTSWQSTPPTLTSTYRYLWNYETINYSNNTSSDTTKRVIGMYSEDGGQGRSVGSVVNYYLATASSSGVTKNTSGWTTSVQSVSITKKYLWNYEVVYDTSGVEISSTNPCIIGAYGDTGLTGEDGVGIDYIVELYYCSSSSSVPTRPTQPVTTSSATSYNTWNKTCAEWTETYQYYYTCLEIHWSDGTVSWTDPVGNNGLTSANQNAAEAIDTAGSAENLANAAITEANEASGKVDYIDGVVGDLGGRVDGIETQYNELEGYYVNLASETATTEQTLTDLGNSFDAFTRGAIFQSLSRDEDGVHISFTSGNSTGEILVDGANIWFNVDGVSKAVINSAGFRFDYGILTTALQVGDNDIDAKPGEWVWTKAESGHFRLVYRGAN